ncbi:unnamed protein product [Brassicogethes aeneus]|uniref:Symplekin n=1 Tax=Brassicogethes aeneus TaxID=1431903 RepID=A0A9P0B7Q6_BRAAE|nr:unnamed protein product [Brassicogethes aeneus]
MEGDDENSVVEWFNEASSCTDGQEKLKLFCKIQEFLIHRHPNLLPKYLQNVLNFTTDKNQDIKKALVGFIEELCKVRESLLPKVMLSLHLLLCDESITVQKRVIQAAITIYRKTLAWLCRATNSTDEMEAAWKQLNTIKLEIANMIDSDNDGIRTSSVKFLECVILLQTYPDEVDNKRENDFSLDDVPLTLKIARRRKLEEEASNLFEVLVKFHGSPHISSANLLACIGVLRNLAKVRAEFMGRVVGAIESLYNNLPPTLSTTQVNAVKKKLKSELLGLIKHPAAFDYVGKITPILLELGCSQSDITKATSKPEDRKKYTKRTLSAESSVQSAAKKPKLDTNYDYEDANEIGVALTPIETNEQFVNENLSVDKAVYLMMTSIPKLPSTMPQDFAKVYNKYVHSGRIGKAHCVHLLAKQLLDNRLGPGGKMEPPPQKEKEPEVISKKREREVDEEDKQLEKEKEKVAKKEKVKVVKIKTLKLSEITKPMDKETKENLLIASVKRMLLSEKFALKSVYQKVVTTFAASFSPVVRDTVLSHLLADLRSNVDLALSLLFEEYSIMQGFARVPPLRKGSRPDQSYNKLLCIFISSSTHDALIISRLLLEAPLITEEAMLQIKEICRDENKSGWALGLLRDLTLRKPPKQLTFLNALLSYTTYDSPVVRENAIGHVLDLHKRPELSMIIEEFARMNLEFLKLQRPPDSLSGHDQGRLKAESWGDDYIKACLVPYVSLLPANESLVHDLAKIYIATNADIKRVILRLIEGPVKSMGMESPELLKLVEECPKGSETLVTRVIHILTDKAPPSSQLVQRVRELYNTRVSDVRFLIPVLNGLSRKEVISALPKLIKLNPIVVKEVFNRLLGQHGESPITPTELLVSLHLIDASKADLKTVIKATSMCLQEKQVFTQEVLAVVLQQLMEQTPLPTLLMRTVIQALGSYPRLSGFVMNILQRLILKQVWKNKVVWEGFVKCCQRTIPQSFTVLMQLPPLQLTDAIKMSADLKDPLKEHLLQFTEAQRAHIPAAVQEIVLGTYKPQPVPAPLPAEMPASQPDFAVITSPPPVSVAVLGSEPLPPGME